MQPLSALMGALASVLVILLSTSIIPSGCQEKLPRQLHCLSEIDIFNQTNKSNQAQDDQPLSLTSYQVDEYVDLDGSRSSVSVYNKATNDARIYYNRLARNSKYSRRKFISYNPNDKTCKPNLIGSWPLAIVCDYVSALLHDMLLPSKISNTAIGPSSLLYTIEDLSSLKYSGSALSKSHLAVVEVYCRRMYPTATQASKGGPFSEPTLLIVHVVSGSRPKPERGTKLEEAHAGSIRDINIVLVGACRMKMFNQGERNGVHEDERDWNLDPKSDLQLGEDLLCHPEKTIFVARYNLVTEYAPGTLVGKSLAELGDSHYEFQREPFMQPTGIGCWDRSISDSLWQKSLTRYNPMEQFSAEYVTEFGALGVSFIAFDRERALFRHDRHGRKNIYDLTTDTSYHVGEFLESHKVFGSSMDSEDRQTLRADAERQLGRCTVHSMRKRHEMDGLAQRLLGLTGGAALERHLGARIIDHANYEVFELELPEDDDSKIPLVLQVPYRLPTFSYRTLKRFVTYYAQPITELSPSLSDDDLARRKREPLVLRYMELWLYDETKGERRLLNRVQFTEFSWQLDVEPTNDPRSGQTRSGELNMRLFDPEECHDERGPQAELVVEFERSDKVELNEQLLTDLRRNKRQISERVHSFLALGLELPQLSLIDLKLRVLNSGNLLATTQIMGFQQSLIDEEYLGAAHASSFDRNFLLKVWHSFTHRYSLEDCELDSLSWPAPNWFGWNKEMAICILVQQDQKFRIIFEPDKFEMPHLFHFYSLRYGLAPTTTKSWAVRRADRGRWRLSQSSLEFELPGESKPTVYEAKPEARSFRQFNSVGGELLNSAALTAGLRYSTMAEDPQAHNMNSRILVPANTRLGAFRFCQLACHMDDFCGSFSVCNRKGHQWAESDEHEDECVLSTVRLSTERLQQVSKAAVENKQAAKFPVRISDELKSQVLQLYRDDSCSINPNDFLSHYTFSSKPLSRLGTKQFDTKKVLRQLSLEDCAGLSYERSLKLKASETNFTHCPLDQNCIVAGDEVKKDELYGYCFDFVANSDRAYNMQVSVQLALLPRNPESESTSANSHRIERVDESNLVKKMWGLKSADCARECNLHASKCLAFDYCYTEGSSLCSLFRFRSPLAESNSYLPKLEVERQLERDYEVKVTSQFVCNHQHLKPDHLEVRLSHLLQLEAKGDGKDPNEERELMIEEREQEIIKHDQLISDEQFDSLIEEESSARKEVGASSRTGGFHFALLLVGIMLGAVATAYRQQLAAGASASYRWYQARRERDEPISTQQLILDDPLST